MWRCARCGTRNHHAVDHCSNCGMPNPFSDGGPTRTVDIPPESIREPEPEKSTAPPWVTISIVGLGLLVISVLVIAILTG